MNIDLELIKEVSTWLTWDRCRGMAINQNVDVIIRAPYFN